MRTNITERTSFSTIVFTNERFLKQIFEKTHRFCLLIERFYLTNGFTARTILLREKEINKWKMNVNFENERNYCF